MLKSHKQCLALLPFALLSSRRVFPFPLPFLSSLIACLLFCPTKRGKARENACNMKRQWQSWTDRKRGREREQDKQPACVEESNEPRSLADASATLLPLAPAPPQATWNKTIIKSTRGWRCGRQRKSKSWLEPAPLTIGLSLPRVGVHNPCQGCTV